MYLETENSSSVPRLSLAFITRDTPDLPDPHKDLIQSQIPTHVAVMGFSILVWEHVVTFRDRVKYIWFRGNCRKRGDLPMVFLFLLASSDRILPRSDIK